MDGSRPDGDGEFCLVGDRYEGTIGDLLSATSLLERSYRQVSNNGLPITVKISPDVPPADAHHIQRMLHEYMTTAGEASTVVEGPELLEAKFHCYDQAVMDLCDKQRLVKKKRERIRELEYEAAELEEEAARLEREIFDALDALHSHALLL